MTMELAIDKVLIDGPYQSNIYPGAKKKCVVFQGPMTVVVVYQCYISNEMLIGEIEALLLTSRLANYWYKSLLVNIYIGSELYHTIFQRRQLKKKNFLRECKT